MSYISTCTYSFALSNFVPQDMISLAVGRYESVHVKGEINVEVALEDFNGPVYFAVSVKLETPKYIWSREDNVPALKVNSLGILYTVPQLIAAERLSGH